MYENGIIGFIHSRKEIIPIFAKWMILADKELPWENFPDVYQRPEGDRVKFLLKDDRERDEIISALTIARIQFDLAELVELTIEQQEWIIGSGISDRSQVDALIETNERIKNASTLEELKTELLSRPSLSRSHS